MITFNELRISDNSGCLIIDCEVEQVDVYKNMFIQSIYIEYYKNANPASMPSEKALCVYDNTTSDVKVRAKRLNVRLDTIAKSDMGVTTFDNGLFYVIVNCGGDPNYTVLNMPCGYDDTRRLGVILDWKALYTRGMQYVNSLFNGCNSCPDLTGFEHFAVLWNALRMAISTCDWNLVNELWDKFLLAPSNPFTSSVAKVSGCGCR